MPVQEHEVVDPRLVLNEAMLKRAAKRLKAAWPTPLKLTQAYQAFAQILGFDSLDHLQRATPSLPAHTTPDALADLVEGLRPHLTQQQVLQVSLTPAGQVVLPSQEKEALAAPVDLGRLGAQLDAAAGGWWPRQQYLTVHRGEVTLTFTARPEGLAVKAWRLGSCLAKIAPGLPPDVKDLLAHHTTGTLLYLGAPSASKAAFIQAVSQDRQALGQRVGLLDPEGTMLPDGYPEEDYFHVGGDLLPGIETAYDLMVIGSGGQITTPRQMVAQYRARRPYTGAITVIRPAESMLDGLLEWAGPEEGGRSDFEELHGVLLHEWSGGGYQVLTRSALAVLAGLPRYRWRETISRLGPATILERRDPAVPPASNPVRTESLGSPGLELTFPSTPNALERRAAQRLRLWDVVVRDVEESAQAEISMGSPLQPLHFEAPTGFDHQPWSPQDHQRLDQALDKLRARAQTKSAPNEPAAWIEAIADESIREALLPSRGYRGGLVVHGGAAGTGKSYVAGQVAQTYVARGRRVALIATGPEGAYPQEIIRPMGVEDLDRYVGRAALSHLVLEEGGFSASPIGRLLPVHAHLASGLSVALTQHADSPLALLRYWWNQWPLAFTAETAHPIRALVYHHRTPQGYAASVLLRGDLVRLRPYLAKDPQITEKATRTVVQAFFRTLAVPA